MASLYFEESPLELADKETVLDCLLRHGHQVPHSCKSGICQSCKLKATDCDIPPIAQIGLSDRQKTEGYFLSCKCIPSSDLKINGRTIFHELSVLKKTDLNESTILLHLEKGAVDFKPGQFVTVVRQSDQLARSYSIASTHDDPFIALHIAILKDGQMSQWLNTLKVGDTLSVSDGGGSCYYDEALVDMPLILAGTGTGLAPLYAVIKDAISKGHQREICLFHAGGTKERLYFGEELTLLANENDQFSYYPCLKDSNNLAHCLQGELSELVMAHTNIDNTTAAFLCGNPEMVIALKKKLFLAGIEFKNIFSDPFVISKQ